MTQNRDVMLSAFTAMLDYSYATASKLQSVLGPVPYTDIPIKIYLTRYTRYP